MSEPPPIARASLERYADLLVGFGANVQLGQILEVRTELGKEHLARAVAASAYRRGARFVDVRYFDPWHRRARVAGADPETLEFYPSWHRGRVLQLGEQRCARIGLSDTPVPGLLDGLDPTLASRDRFPFVPEYLSVIDDNTTNWCGAVCPTAEWASLVHPDLAPGEALALLWEQVLHVCRLDEDDPIASWRERLEALDAAESQLNERRFDALHFAGPGTDLTVGLLPGSRWRSGASETVDGIVFLANLPTEEAFTAPDPARTEGVVRSTRPLQLRSGVLVRDLVVRFEGGRAVQVDASTGVEALRGVLARDEGAARLGEVALVDRGGRVGTLDTVFYFTLLDENAASHVAFGNAYAETVDEGERERANSSSIHVDFMIGGDDVQVDGLTRGGERVPVLRAGSWQI